MVNDSFSRVHSLRPTLSRYSLCIQRKSIQLVAIHYPFLPLFGTENITAATFASAPERPMFQKQMLATEALLCLRGNAIVEPGKAA